MDGLEPLTIKGDPGTPATIQIGTVTTGDQPSVTNSGTASNAVFNFVIPAGQQGANGKSAYDLAIENQTTNAPDEASWLGTLGGKSAYEVARDNGYTGTQADWLASLKGDKGDPGDKGDTALTLKIGKVTVGEQPSVTNSGTATDLVLDFVLPDTQTIQWDNYTTTTDLEKKLNGKQDKQDMANYYDAKSVDKLLANKADLSTVASVPDKVDVQNLKTENQQLRDQVTTLSGQLLKVQSDVAAINAKLATLPAK
ncbi:hypothetical protein FC21_GL000636 [Limosilactobacillus equigenerosi DSM 18793 = JCM 14505]|uniref:Uncharacterized protein n=3 Tax=Limosilactobacillus TaxID=2742598 RepID=A0A0R1UTL1_9LACO|nr:hypothetical protein FC21_GL000636 [Limosilactobacillus equigenerosi DSM 18793 = JCM 14505]